MKLSTRIFDSFSVRAFLIAASVVVFLLVFRPFALDLDSGWKLYVYLGLGLVIFAALHLNHYLFFPLIQRIPQIGEKYRPVFSRIYLSSFTIFAIYVYFSYFSQGQSEFNVSLIVKIALVALLPIVTVHILGQRQELKRQVLELKTDLSKMGSNDAIVLQSENGKEKLQLQKEQILFVRAEDNYVAIAHLAPDGVREVLLRATLSSLEHLLKDRGIIRCHRSFLVNLSNVQRLHAGAGGQVLDLKGDTACIPVSRTYLPALRQMIEQTRP